MGVLNTQFDEKANTLFKAVDVEQLLAENGKMLWAFIADHKAVQVPRLKRLEKTYLGFNDAINRRDTRESHLADYRATHDFAKYTVDFTTGYVVGNPISYKVEKQSEQKLIDDFNQRNDIDTHDYNLIEDCSIFGRAYELVYRNEEGLDKVVQISPFEAFMIYDHTREQNPLGGVVYYEQPTVDGKVETHATLYTADRQYRYVDGESGVRADGDTEHYYGDVQLNEYWNNRFRTCDFEHVLDLMDLYDIAQSDTANYMTDLNDAMLKIEGDVKIKDTNEANKMKKSRIILAKPARDANGSTGSVNVDYIYKKYDVQGVEAYKDRIKQDIHLLTYTPDLSDDNFSGVQSGEAMKYKLTSLEQLRVKKERSYKKALSKRYKLLSRMLNLQNLVDDPSKRVKIEFTPNVPKTRREMIELFMKLGGNLSERTKLSLLDFVENIDHELKQIEQERSEAQEQQPDEYDQNADKDADKEEKE